MIKMGKNSIALSISLSMNFSDFRKKSFDLIEGHKEIANLNRKY